MRENRSPERFRLRVYIDAIKDAESTTDRDWVDRWATFAGPDSKYVSRADFIAWLKACVVREVERDLNKEEAA